MNIFAKFSSDGRVEGFYSVDVHGSNIPEGAVELTQYQYNELLENQATKRWDGSRVVDYDPPPHIPTIEEYRMAIQSMIDTKAQEKDYDSGATLASYVNSTIPEWSAEATAFVAWRDDVWLHALTELDKVQNGQREQPSVESFLAELPTFEWDTGEQPS